MENNQADPQLYTQPNPNFLQIADERPKKSFNYKALIALLITVVVGLAALLVYSFTQIQQLKQQVEVVEIGEPKSVEEAVEQTQANPKANWSTFNDSLEGISFEYPSSWSATKSLGPGAYSVRVEDHKLSDFPETDALPAMHISYVGDYIPDTDQFQIENISLEEAIDRYSDWYRKDSLMISRDLKTSNKPSAELKGYYEKGQLQGQFAQSRLIKLNDRVLVINLYDESSYNTYNQILSTLELVN